MVSFKSVLALALPLLVVATPLTVRNDACSKGTLKCCNRLEKPNATNTAGLLGLLDLTGALQGLLGLECTNLPIIGVAGTSCTQQTVCCSNNQFGPSLVGIDCTPININL